MELDLTGKTIGNLVTAVSTGDDPQPGADDFPAKLLREAGFP